LKSSTAQFQNLFVLYKHGYISRLVHLHNSLKHSVRLGQTKAICCEISAVVVIYREQYQTAGAATRGQAPKSGVRIIAFHHAAT
jgi:hypothetical protein